jgi:UDP-N-acetylmuramyl pentapeptide synthase
LKNFEAGSARKVLVLGSINYGSGDSTGDYLQVIESVEGGCDEILLVGDFTKSLEITRLPKAVRLFETTRQCADDLLPRVRSGDLVVLKCRNMHEHLRRLEISRRATVNCWQMDCERKSFCDECRFLEEHID